LATIHDIARESRVSARTVSRVLNGAAAVDAETRSRVLEVIERLDYRPDPGAQSLKTKRRRVIAVVVNAVASDATMRRVETLAKRFGPLGYAVMVAWADDAAAEDREIRELSRRADALIAFSNAPGPRSPAFDRLEASGFPFLVVDPPVPVVYPAFYLDRAGGYQKATLALAGAGRRRIALLIEGFRSVERLAGYRAGLAAAFGNAAFELVVRTGKGFEGGRNAAPSIIDLPAPERPDALLCHNDRLAAGFLSIAAARGVRVPEDLALIGFDDEAWAPFLQPPLASIRVAGDEVGDALFEALRARLEDERPFVSATFPTEPEFRASAGLRNT